MNTRAHLHHLIALAPLLIGPLVAQEPRQAAPPDTATAQPAAPGTPSDVAHKVGYERPPAGMGGPSAVTAQLEEDDRLPEPVRRFPQFDRAFKPWFDFKSRLNEDVGLRFGIDYNTLYQGLDGAIGEENKAAVGLVRAYGTWTLFGRESNNTGSLVFKVDQRHRLGTKLSPTNLAGQAGYIGVTGLLFSDVELVVVDLNWQQMFNGGDTGLLAGRFDPNDYLGVLGYANPWTAFSNLAVLLNPSVAFPDMGYGVGAGHWFNDQWYAKGSISDANGVVTDLDFYQGGAEFFTWGEVGWSPSKGERYTRNIHVAVWHVDEREQVGVPSAEGITFGANYTTRDQRWMGFVRAGRSRGAAPIYNNTATIGFTRSFRRNSDALGVAFNWGDPPDGSLRNQTTGELFYRLQFATNFAVTPSVQMLHHPSLHPQETTVWLLGIRVRVTL